MYIFGTQSPKYKAWYARQGIKRNNGSYYYSKEIENIILPELKDLELVVITAGAALYHTREVPNGSVVVCHDNRTTRKSYGMLFKKDILWICSKESTVNILKGYGEKAVYIPLSIDTKYVEKFKRKRRLDKTAFVGNSWGFKREYLASLPEDIVQLSDMNRDDLLKEMAKYKKVIAEGRCLMEAQVLGADCEVPQYQNGLEAVFVDVLDSKDAVVSWREALEPFVKDGVCIIRAVREFKDLEVNRLRKPGEIFTVNKERAQKLLSNDIKIVEKV